MRDLKKTDKNVLVISDSISGSDIELYYRNPTAPEIVAYQKSMYKRDGNKLKIDPACRLDHGLKILTGFRDGDFGVDGKPLSADPASENYQENWKDLVKESAADIVMVLALHVFEGVRTGTQEKIEIDIEAGEDVPPLVKS